MWSSVWFWLRRLWPLWLALAVASGGYRAGYLKRDAAADAEMAAVKAEWRQKQLAAEQAYSAQLAAANAERQRWHDYAQRQTVQLARALQDLDARENQIKREIADAVRKDAQSGACAGGLGADGLRLYNRALGY